MKHISEEAYVKMFSLEHITEVMALDLTPFEKQLDVSLKDKASEYGKLEDIFEVLSKVKLPELIPDYAEVEVGIIKKDGDFAGTQHFIKHPNGSNAFKLLVVRKGVYESSPMINRRSPKLVGVDYSDHTPESESLIPPCKIESIGNSIIDALLNMTYKYGLTNLPESYYMGHKFELKELDVYLGFDLGDYLTGEVQ